MLITLQSIQQTLLFITIGKYLLGWGTRVACLRWLNDAMPKLNEFTVCILDLDSKCKSVGKDWVE